MCVCLHWFNGGPGSACRAPGGGGEVLGGLENREQMVQAAHRGEHHHVSSKPHSCSDLFAAYMNVFHQPAVSMAEWTGWGRGGCLNCACISQSQSHTKRSGHAQEQVKDQDKKMLCFFAFHS